MGVFRKTPIVSDFVFFEDSFTVITEKNSEGLFHGKSLSSNEWELQKTSFLTNFTIEK